MSPFDLRLESIARFLNCEISDHPVYDGLEVQVFDDPQHGSGMLVFLTRRADQRADFYISPGLELDPASFHIGGGMGRWGPAELDVARLELHDDGVVAQVAFTDDEGRPIELEVDDRDGHLRHRSRLLAPVSASIQDPRSLMLVYLTGFDLVRTRGTARLRIGEHEVDTGHLPLEGLHHHRLIKVSEGLAVVHLNRQIDGGPLPDGPREVSDGRHRAHLVVEPELHDLSSLAQGRHQSAWHVQVQGDRLTGGTVQAERVGDRVGLVMEVTEPWTPHGLPPLVWGVTRIVPVFRQWPTTYRWTATVDLRTTPATLRSAWTRSGDLGEGYRQATGSS